MRPILTRLATAGIAGLIAASAIVSASAAPRHKRHVAPAPAEYSDPALQLAPVAAAPGMPASAWAQPNGCVTDEGYGRFASCDQPGF